MAEQHRRPSWGKVIKDGVKQEVIKSGPQRGKTFLRVFLRTPGDLIVTSKWYPERKVTLEAAQAAFVQDTPLWVDGPVDITQKNNTTGESESDYWVNLIVKTFMAPAWVTEQGEYRDTMRILAEFGAFTIPDLTAGAEQAEAEAPVPTGSGLVINKDGVRGPLKFNLG